MPIQSPPSILSEEAVNQGPLTLADSQAKSSSADLLASGYVLGDTQVGLGVTYSGVVSGEVFGSPMISNLPRSGRLSARVDKERIGIRRRSSKLGITGTG